MNTLVQIPTSSTGATASSAASASSTSSSASSSSSQIISYQQQAMFIPSSSSPLSNSSSNSSSSCLTAASYSPLQQQPQPQQSIIYTQAANSSMPGLNHSAQPIILTLPVVGNSNGQQQLIAQITSNPNMTAANPNMNAANSVTVCLDNSSSNTSSIYSYTSSNASGKPEAKKVKTQRTQPSKVVHIRNIPQQITEIEIIQFGLIFGNIANVLNLRSKCQVMLYIFSF